MELAYVHASDTKLYAIKALTLLAETPEGKQYLQSKNFGKDWNVEICQKNCYDSLQVKRAKHIAHKVFYKKV